MADRKYVVRGMEERNINVILSVEMLEQVFSMLALRDLKTVMEACRKWAEVDGAPALWTLDFLKVYRYNLALMLKFLGIRRFHLLKGM